ncbi:MAG: DUF1800 family protein [Rubrivivax sp.]
MNAVFRCLLSALLAALLVSCGGGSGEPEARRVPLAAGSTAAAGDRDDLYRFFAIAFGAAPGTTYMAQLVQAVEAGMTVRQIVNAFTTKPQFLQLYPIALSPREFAQRLVDNVVGDSAGPLARTQAVDEIVAALALPGWTRGDVVYTLFDNLARKPPDDPLWASTAKKLAVQVAYARYFTETLKISSTELAVLRSPLASVTQNSPTADDLMLKAIQAASRSDVARFLGQAAFAANEAEIARVQALGYSGWIDEQVGKLGSPAHVAWLSNSDRGLNHSLWRKLMSSPDVLRQRVTLAYSEIFVVSITGLMSLPGAEFAVAAYVDMLSDGAFGNFRKLLEDITLSPAMGIYLNMRGNRKEDVATGRQPDENYAREVMQLFSIGLHQLNLDGTPKAGTDGELLETYDNDDVTGLAKVLTGWDLDFSKPPPDGLEFPHMRRPMAFFAARHSTAEKRFLGTHIAPGSIDGPGDLKKALDTIFLHPNVGPFIGRQLIQRMVTSNPSPAYVARVAAVFNDNGSGVRGDMGAVIKALLTDVEATTAAASAHGGRLVEPIVRLIAWARVFGVTSADDAWRNQGTGQSSRLGHAPLRSPSVFNFFRPGYTPPNTALSLSGLLAPEFQVTDEISVVAYVNFMQDVIANGFDDIKANYAALKDVSVDAPALVDKVALWFNGRLSAQSRQDMVEAINAMPADTEVQRIRRQHAAVLLIMSSPEYLVQK